MIDGLKSVFVHELALKGGDMNLKGGRTYDKTESV